MQISKFREKGQIPQLGLKFHDPQKTVGPNDCTYTKLVQIIYLQV